ncbi:MAG: hypothetical protein K2F92_00135 [Alistipes sp.]|nr:hypothetical protein [Alistipes sp.]
MKNLLSLCLLGMFAVSCIDKSYDLTDIDTDRIAIGDETSRFTVPLVTVTVLLDDIHDAKGSLQEMLAEADTWLPSRLPGGAEYVDFARLYTDDAYLAELTGALVDEMGRSTDRLNEVADLAWKSYRKDFLAPLGLNEATVDKARFTEAFVALFATSEQLRRQTEASARKYLQLLEVSDLSYDLGKLDLGDVVDMLADNLDPQGTVDPVNTLSIEGEVSSTLPLTMRLYPKFEPTGLTLEPFDIEVDATCALPSTRIYAEDLRALAAAGGVTIAVPVELQRYYPGRTLDPRPIAIRLSLLKTGSLKLDL